MEWSSLFARRLHCNRCICPVLYLHYFVLSIHPQNPIALNNLACALMNQEKYSPALQCLQETLRLDPSQEYAKSNIQKIIDTTVGGEHFFEFWPLLWNSGWRSGYLIMITVVFTFAAPPAALVLIAILLYNRHRTIQKFKRENPGIFILWRNIKKDYKEGRLQD